jgi:hypothetical protein
MINQETLVALKMGVQTAKMGIDLIERCPAALNVQDQKEAKKYVDLILGKSAVFVEMKCILNDLEDLLKDVAKDDNFELS